MPGVPNRIWHVDHADPIACRVRQPSIAIPHRPECPNLLLDHLKLGFATSDLLVNFLDHLPRRNIDDILALIDQFTLDLKSDGLVLHNAADNVVSGFDSILTMGELCILIEDRFKKLLDQLPFTGIPNAR